jgi:hypothetical protein
MRVIITIIGLSLLCDSADAQQADPAIAQSRKAYEDCVYDSVIAQLQQMSINTRRSADMSALGEQGFLACATEERVLGMILANSNVSPQVVQAALLGNRARIKRTLRQIAADPENYGKQQSPGKR